MIFIRVDQYIADENFSKNALFLVWELVNLAFFTVLFDSRTPKKIRWRNVAVHFRRGIRIFATSELLFCGPTMILTVQRCYAASQGAVIS